MPGMFGRCAPRPRYYSGYYDHVRRAIPPHRRLDYHLGSGWAPLCEFLGREIPDVEFPRVNEAEEHAKRADAFARELAMRAWRRVQPYFVSTTVIATALAGLYMYKKMRCELDWS